MARFSKDHSPGRRRQSTWQRWLPLLAAIVLIGFWISIYLSGQKYSKEAILQEYFVDPSQHIEGNISTDLKEMDENYLKSQFLVGAQNFKNKNYQKALDTYENILINGVKDQYHIEENELMIAEVNKLLCFLGMDDMEKVNLNLDFLMNPAVSGSPKKVATEIKGKINSFWYGWAN